MGDSGPAHKVGKFSSRADDLHIGEILLVVYLRVVRLHGVLVSIVSDKDPRFTAHFCRVFLQKVVISMYFLFLYKNKI